MSEFQIIESALDRAGKRLRQSRALRGLWQGALLGAILGFVIIGLFHVLPLPYWVPAAAAALPVAAMLAGYIAGGWRKPTRMEMARFLDAREHLQERLSTALEIKSASEEAWGRLVLSDAVAHLQAWDARRLLPFHLPRATRWAVFVLALTAALGFVPEYRSKAHIQKQVDQQIIKESGKQLAELTRHSLEKRPPVLDATRKSMESVSELGERLSQKVSTRGEALKDLANMAEQIKNQIDQMARDPQLKRMQEAAQSPSGSESQNAAAVQKQIESLQKQLSSNATADQMDKLKQQLDKLQQAARGMSDDSKNASAEEKSKMAESLSSLSRQAQEMGLQLPQLDEAMAALAASRTDMVLKDLEAATTDLEKMKEMAKSMQALQQQMEKIGKDLAEQLKNGQPEAAKSTLDKMAKELQAGNLSKEQLQKLLDEVKKAVDPASQYGKVAEHLKDASQQMNKGDQQAASACLAKAASELDKMMQQMGDAKSLASELAALDKASEAIATGQSWGKCQSSRPGSGGKGGKPGSGVGTWADENAGWGYTPQMGERTDNSNVRRPDMAARGHSDRPGEDMDDAFKPTKVKGQFTPGGPMPSISLKGVSIKGQSKVAYEEAAAAAQADAQSALSQEKVPRAYQGAVRDYFDDLKK